MIKLVETEDEVRACYAVMAQLRPHLGKRMSIVAHYFSLSLDV